MAPDNRSASVMLWIPVLTWALAALASLLFSIDDSSFQKVLGDLLSRLDDFASSLGHLPPINPNPLPQERTLKDGEIPRYCIDFAPLVHLYSEERYMPYDIASFVENFKATWGNGSVIAENVSIDTLGDLPNSDDVYLTLLTDFDADPDWITGKHNHPSLIDGLIKEAPATLVVVDKGNGWVDAFWFYFYLFNLGPYVMGAGPYGNHVGDWEHSLVRFYNGKPQIVWMLAHGGGAAFKYEAMEKYAIDQRHPIIFSATGTHANYALVGQFPHDLPYNILCDFTDRGELWNPSRNYLGYTFDGINVFYAQNWNRQHQGREKKYGHWLKFSGHWGDAEIPMSDPRQKYNFIGGHKYIDGPTGPLLKNLLRSVPCERHKWWNVFGVCRIRHNLHFGIGVELEGYNCGAIFDWVRPRWLKLVLDKLTWGGVLCFVADLIGG